MLTESRQRSVKKTVRLKAETPKVVPAIAIVPEMPATDLDVKTPDAIKAPYRKGKKA